MHTSKYNILFQHFNVNNKGFHILTMKEKLLELHRVFNKLTVHYQFF